LECQFKYFSALLLGFLVGICEIPCTGAIYLATVALLSVRETFLVGLFYLLLYNLMFILPLVLVFLLVGSSRFYEWLQSAQQKTARMVRLLMGLAMLTSGVLLFIWLISSLS
jgi:cytochrome c biogenesis protein CcdA